MTPAHCRAARAWLGWTQTELSQRAGIGLTAIKTFEANQRHPHKTTVALLRQALSFAGIECSPVGIYDRRNRGGIEFLLTKLFA